MMSTEPDGSGIAVIGMVGRFPGARDLEEFWRNLRDGKESIRFLSDQELVARGLEPAALGDPDHVKAVAELDDPDSFDAEFFGISHREAEIMDPQQRIFLECAWQALESAGYQPEDYDGAIALFAGATASTYLVFNLVANCAFERSWDPLELLVANAGDSLATRVSYKLNLKGPSFTVQCACSTSLVAVHLACESLLAEQCDLAVAGGISINVAQRTGYRYQEGSIASPDGHCRPFDARARGTVFGSGVGIVVLKRLADALADGDTIRAVILGSAVNNDGALKVGYTAPSVEGQSEVIAEALSVADVAAESISYVEAHGTATNLGDPIEIQALTRAFRTATDKTGFCAIGSVKSNIGHLDVAAGISGLIKTILALEHRQIPPSLHFEEPNPKIDFARSPVYVNTELRDWQSADGPRRAGVSSFGFGGTNAHLIVEEAPVVPPSGESRPWQLLVLSARSREVLDQATGYLAAHLRTHPELELADVAYTLAVGRKNFLHRRILVCRDPEEAAALLAGGEPRRVLTGTDTQDPRRRPVVFMFTGQGAQYVNMGRELYDREPVFRDAVDRCARRLELVLGWDLRPVLYPPPGADQEAAAERLRQTAVTQVALFVVEYALAAVWQEWGIGPAAMIGHSIGEYVAAHLAGVLSLDDALALVAARGRLMQEAPAGAMLSVPLPEEEVQALLTPELALAAVNGPARCVVSGPETALGELASRLAERGVEPRRLHTSHAFHSAMMEPVLERFAAELRRVRLRRPEIAYLSNLTGTWVTAAQATDPSYWVRHLRETVRFGAGLAELAKEPERILLEVGPGQTLTQLARRQLGDQVVVASMRPVRDPEASDLAVLLTALGHLWLAGREIEWPRIFGAARRRRLPLPTYPFARRSYWIEPGKAAARPAAKVGKKTAIEDWFYLPAWRPTLPPPKWRPEGQAQASDRWLIFADDCGLGLALGEELSKAGGEVFTVTAGAAYARRDGHGFVLDPGRPEDYDLLFADLGRAVTGIVHLWSVSRPPGGGFDRAQQRGYYSLLYLARTLDRLGEADPIRIVVAATDVLAVSGPEACPEKATVMGPALVLAQELPHVSCRVVDLELAADDPGPACARLLAELAAETSDPIVAWRGPRRLVPSFEPVRLAAGATGRRLRDGGVYLITGGLGPTGLRIAEILASQLRPRLVLVDDGAFPERAQWESHQDGDGPTGRTIGRLMALEKAGAQLLVTAADVADREQLEAVMRTAEERFGPLDGLIHAAGAAAGQSVYRPLAALSRAESEEHFRRTARAARAVEQVVAGRGLDFVLLFTSTAAVLGGLGLAATAAADRFINALATARPAGGTEWISAGWDHWPAPGEEGAGAVGASTDELAMTAEERREAFLRLLAQAPEGQIVVSTGDLAARVRRWLERVPARPERRGALHDRPDLATDYVAPRTPLEREIAAVWQDLLGTREVGIDDNFFDLGGDSFLAVQVVSRLRKALGRDLPVVSLYEGLTVKALADLLTREEDEAAAREETVRELEEARSRRREYQRRRRAVKREGLGFSLSGLSED